MMLNMMKDLKGCVEIKGFDLKIASVLFRNLPSFLKLQNDAPYDVNKVVLIDNLFKYDADLTSEFQCFLFCPKIGLKLQLFEM